MSLKLILACGIIAAVVEISAFTPPWPSPYWNIPGDYCRAKYRYKNCCDGRNDPCSVEILGTLCYCDTFCNRTHNSDCCPDYFTHCEGLPPLDFATQQPPASLARPDYTSQCPHGVVNGEDSQCYLNGQLYSIRDTAQQNCNVCKCQISLKNPNCMEWMCDTDKCLMDEELLENLVQSQNYLSWTPTNYSQFWGRTLVEGQNGKLGTDSPLPLRMSAIRFRYKEKDLPQTFDSRSKWRDLNSDVQDQGWCGASWAFSTASVASDRFVIDSKGDSLVELSAGSIIACNIKGQSGCDGGNTDRAWNFLRKYGTVPEECSPYSISEDPVQKGCKLPRLSHYPLLSEPLEEKFEIFKICPPVAKRQSLFKMQPPYKVGRKNSLKHPRRTEFDIMFEIQMHGPVQATMAVYKDFFMYESGVYSRSQFASGTTPLGYHSVKIIGWGEERNVPYWMVANSWGKDWGQNGYFRIKRGVNECGIEDFVVGAWAQTDKHLKQLRQFRLMQRRREQQRHRRHHRHHRSRKTSR